MTCVRNAPVTIDALRRSVPVLVVLAAAVALAGCSPRGEYLVARSPEGVLTVQVLDCDPTGVEGFTVYDASGTEMLDADDEIWRITRDPSSTAPEVVRVEVGTVPDGYTEEVPFRPEAVTGSARLRFETYPGVGNLANLDVADVAANGRVHLVDDGDPSDEAATFEEAAAAHADRCDDAETTARIGLGIVLASLVLAGASVVALVRRRPVLFLVLQPVWLAGAAVGSWMGVGGGGG